MKNTNDGTSDVVVTQNTEIRLKPEGNCCVVSGSHALILRISSLFGLAPLRFEPGANGSAVSISSAMCAYSYILVTVLIVCTVVGLAAEINVGMEVSVRMGSRLSQAVSACDVLVVVLTAAAGVYGAPRRMRTMIRYMESVATVDNNLSVEYSMATERKLSAILLTVLIFFSILIADDFAFYAIEAKKYNRQWDIVSNYISFYLLYYIVVILELQFAFTALSVRGRFRAVNNALANTARHISLPVEATKERSALNIFAVRVSPATSGVHNISLLVDSLNEGYKSPTIIRKTVSGQHRLSVPPCEAVRRLASLHGALCDVVRQIDDSYGLPLVVILLSTLLHLIVTPYFLILELIVSSKRVHFLVLQFLWCATHLLRMFVVVEPCHYTVQEGRRTEDMVCRLMACSPSSGTLPSRLELFSRQLLMRSVTYSPMGMCIMDRPLIATVIGAVTTYLVILIQFQRYDDK